MSGHRRPPLLPAMRSLAPALAGRPSLWPAAWQLARSLVPGHWWRRWPPLPLPDAEWLCFRLETAYGRSDRAPDGADVLAMIEWLAACRAFARFRGTH